MKRFLCCGLAALMLVFCLGGCGAGADGEIRHVTRQFFDGVSELDFDKALDCLEPSMSNVLRTTLGSGLGLIGGMVGGRVGQEFLGQMDGQFFSDLIKVSNDLGLSEAMPELGEMPSIEIEATVDNIVYNEDKTYARGDVTLLIRENDEEYTQEGYLYYTKIDGDWYISNENFATQ